MCDPVTLAIMAASTAATIGGTVVSGREAVKNDAREADARNKVLRDTMSRNQMKADDNREIFNKRITESAATPMQTQLGDAQAGQVQAIEGNLDATAAESPIAGDAPKVVKSNLSAAMADSFAKSKEKAKALGELGGYNAQGRDDAIADTELGMAINTNNDAVRGNLGVMPYLQDYAALRVRKPSSGLGQMLTAAGQAGSTYAGAR
jgi:hypothetical protein